MVYYERIPDSRRTPYAPSLRFKITKTCITATKSREAQMKSCILYFLPSFRSYGAKKIQQYNFCDFRYISVPIDQIDCKSCIFLEVVFFLHRKNGGYSPYTCTYVPVHLSTDAGTGIGVSVVYHHGATLHGITHHTRTHTHHRRRSGEATRKQINISLTTQLFSKTGNHTSLIGEINC